MTLSGNGDSRLTRHLVQLFTGLVLYGVSMAVMVRSTLGLTSWDVLHQGLAKVTGLDFGWVVILLGVPILLLWIPLRQRPGFGTIVYAVAIGPLVHLFLPLFTVPKSCNLQMSPVD